MNIGIDISPVIYGTGVSVYTKNLVRNLLEIDKINKYIFFGGSLRRKKEFKEFTSSLQGASSFVNKFLFIPPTVADILWNRFHIMPIETILGDLDVFHSSDWTQPPSKAFKVTTIHDLSPILFPDITDHKIVSAHKSRLKWVLKEVDRVIVPSRTTAEDVIKLGIDKEKVRIITEAVDPIYKPATSWQIGNIKKRYRISGKYFIAIGVNPRKNTERIIKAFDQIKSDIDAKLVVVGHPYLKVESSSGVVFTGHVSQKDLPILFSGSELLVYPSLYEGFGIPILEAYNTHTPVVTSKIGSMLEIGINSAILVDPYSVGSIVNGMRQALKNKDVLIKKGILESKKYSWLENARETLRVYNEAKI